MGMRIKKTKKIYIIDNVLSNKIRVIVYKVELQYK
jgi:hypothetical protein